MKAFLKFAIVAFALAQSVEAQAHRAWLLPSATVLSGSDPWVTVDAAISNDLFYFEHFPMRLDGLVVTAPDGAPAEFENASTGRYRSTFDVHLTRSGTYRLAVVGHGVFVRYELNGERKRWRGKADGLAEAIPLGAKNVRISESHRRMETFVTAGKPTREALAPSGKGLELVPLTHPNDLFVGEKAKFRLLLDGKPAAGAKVVIIRSGIRYRDRLAEISVTAGPDGAIEVEWPEPGMYWLGAEIRDDKASIERAERRASYAVTLEVLPQ